MYALNARIRSVLAFFGRDVRGANFVEYMLVVAAVAIAGTAALAGLTKGVKDGADAQGTKIAPGFIK